jgi:SAM-dependent methyltransferase
MTPAMLEVARKKEIYRELHLEEVSQTRFPSASYELCVQSLADEHLPELTPLYRETARLVRPGGTFVIVGYHPQFLMMGIPTHFNRATGEPVTIRSYVHLLSDHVKAAHEAGWMLREMDEALVDEAWIRRKPKWEKYLGLPISFAMVWRR